MLFSKKLFAGLTIVALSAMIYIFRQPIMEAWMRYDLRNEDIVVSLTTTPHRIAAIQPVIDFILNEKTPLKNIYLNIPYVFKRDNIEYQIPESLINNPRVTILRTQDYGPATKLLATLQKANLPEKTILITLDDDIQYPPNILLYLAYKAKHTPGTAIGLSGMNPHYNKYGNVIVDSLESIGLKSDMRNNASVSVLEGFAGIAYRPYFFNQQVFDIQHAPRECRNSDDIYLSFQLAKNGIPRKVLRAKHMNLDLVQWNRDVGFKQDALHQLSPRPAERHKACIAYLQAQYPAVQF